MHAEQVDMHNQQSIAPSVKCHAAASKLSVQSRADLMQNRRLHLLQAQRALLLQCPC